MPRAETSDEEANSSRTVVNNGTTDIKKFFSKNRERKERSDPELTPTRNVIDHSKVGCKDEVDLEKCISENGEQKEGSNLELKPKGINTLPSKVQSTDEEALVNCISINNT